MRWRSILGWLLLSFIFGLPGIANGQYVAGGISANPNPYVAGIPIGLSYNGYWDSNPYQCSYYSEYGCYPAWAFATSSSSWGGGAGYWQQLNGASGSTWDFSDVEGPTTYGGQLSYGGNLDVYWELEYLPGYFYSASGSFGTLTVEQQAQPVISGLNVLWWFGPDVLLNVSGGYNVHTTLSANAPSASWSVVQGSLFLVSNVGPAIEAYSQGPSADQEDVHVVATVNGVASEPLRVTVKSPTFLDPVVYSSSQFEGLYYLSQQTFAVRSQFGDNLADLAINEQFDSTQVFWSGSDWHLFSNGATPYWLTSAGGTIIDSMWYPLDGNPDPWQFQFLDPATSVFGRNQRFRSGSQEVGEGFFLRDLFQRYNIGFARHDP